MKQEGEFFTKYLLYSFFHTGEPKFNFIPTLVIKGGSPIISLSTMEGEESQVGKKGDFVQS